MTTFHGPSRTGRAHGFNPPQVTELSSFRFVEPKRWYGPSSNCHMSNALSPRPLMAALRAASSASGVDCAVAVCPLEAAAQGKRELGPCITWCSPEVLLRVYGASCEISIRKEVTSQVGRVVTYPSNESIVYRSVNVAHHMM